ncbi:unnamed protein product, partial [Amoebophrya sp. A25]|eukprot:GSA25T00025354001.1
MKPVVRPQSRSLQASPKHEPHQTETRTPKKAAATLACEAASRGERCVGERMQELKAKAMCRLQVLREAEEAQRSANENHDEISEQMSKCEVINKQSNENKDNVDVSSQDKARSQEPAFSSNTDPDDASERVIIPREPPAPPKHKLRSEKKLNSSTS